MNKSLSEQDWKKIGLKTQECTKSNHALLSLLSSKLPEDSYIQRWSITERALGKMRMHLSKMYYRKFYTRPKTEAMKIFYGEDEF